MNIRLRWQHRQWLRLATLHARMDASARVKQPPFLDRVAGWGSQLCHAVAIRFHQSETQLLIRCRKEEADLRRWEAAAREARALSQQRQEEYCRAQAASDQKHQELNPPDGSWSISPWAYRLAFAGLCLGDLPLTFLAFQTFDLDPIMTMIVATVTVLLLAALGHFAGAYARRLGWREVHLLGAVLTLSAGFVMSLTVLRETAIQAVATDAAMSGPGPVAVFALLTAMGFVVPALLAYHVRHEPLAHLVRTARRRWRQAARTAYLADRQRDRHQVRLVRAQAERHALLASALNIVASLRHIVSDVVHSYRLEYVRQTEGEEPEALRHPPAIAVPETLVAAAAEGRPRPVEE